MNLTKETFKAYAETYYDNPYCISEEEFNKDLRQISTIKRMISKYMTGQEVDIKLLVNNVIIFYNVFDNHAATNLLGFKSEDDQKPYINSVLEFLSLPVLIPPKIKHEEFYTKLKEEFK